MSPESNEIHELIELITQIIQNRNLPANLSEYEARYPQLQKLVSDLVALREFTYTLSGGDLSQTLGMRGYWPGALKALQSNLRHLSWQTGMVASGDYSQRVDFMGDFSVAFNAMTIRLKEAIEKERQYIAELERSQAVIREKERKYRLIAENTDDVIWLLDAGMIIRYISPSIEKLSGCAPEAYEGKPAAKTPLPFLQAVFREAAVAFAEDGDLRKPLIIEWEQPRQGAMIWTESSVSAARNGQGEFIGFLGVTRDISERKKTEALLQQAYERRKKNDFFNQLITRDYGDDALIRDLARQNKLSLPKDFSLLFLSIANIDAFIDQQDELHRKEQIVDALVDHLNRKENSIAWEAARGIGIIVPAAQGMGLSQKDKEMEEAEKYLNDLSVYLPDLQQCIGIADYAEGWADFAQRLKKAETAVKIGRRVWPDRRLYHYEECGIYQVLAPFAASSDALAYIAKTIGPLLEHDQNGGTDLVQTLEKLLSGLSFKEIGAQMYLHHKTIQLRKQRIEQILNVSLDAFETRMALATALQLLKISDCLPLKSGNGLPLPKPDPNP